MVRQGDCPEPDDAVTAWARRPAQADSFMLPMGYLFCMKRRRVLIGCSTVLAGALAGCGSDGGSDEPTPTETPESTPTQQEISLEDGSSGSTPTETPTATPTETPADTPTPTATPAPAGNTHALEEQFTVGEDDNAVTYRILDFYRADDLGNAASKVTADGTFLIVVLEITNPQDSQIVLPREDFRARSSRTWHQYHRNATEQIAFDDRIDEQSLANTGIRSGRSVTGAVAFDVDPDSSYELWITPAGGPDTPEHFVPVGEIPAVQEL